MPHAMVRLKSGELAYITRRMDRTKDGKVAMEDLCQVTGRLTEDKYRGSLEQVGKAILAFSDQPGLDAVDFFELVLFCFLAGNADLHLKDFDALAFSLGLAEKVRDNAYLKLGGNMDKWEASLEKGFLSIDLLSRYSSLMLDRARILGLNKNV